MDEAQFAHMIDISLSGEDWSLGADPIHVNPRDLSPGPVATFTHDTAPGHSFGPNNINYVISREVCRVNAQITTVWIHGDFEITSCSMDSEKK